MQKIPILASLTRPLRSVATLAVVLLTLVGIVSLFGPGFIQRFFERLSARVTTITSGPVVVERLQALNRLETARQTSSQVVEAKSARPYLPSFLGEDKLLMMVQTEAVAGVDLSQLAQQDVQVKHKEITLRLPEAELFAVRIDDEQTKVYSRDQGWLVFKPDNDLERKARLKALADARTAAGKEVITVARANAETNIRQLLTQMGFEKVTIL